MCLIEPGLSRAQVRNPSPSSVACDLWVPQVASANTNASCVVAQTGGVADAPVRGSDLGEEERASELGSKRRKAAEP